MMHITQQQEKKVLIIALAVLGILVAYRMTSVQTPKTAPLAFPPGSVSHSAVRQGLLAAATDAASLNLILARRAETFPGVVRDIFRMENPAPKPKTAPLPVPASPPPAPELPQRTPEEIAADQSRAELAKFRFLGYLTEKDRKLFLSKDGELFIVKGGERVIGNYQVKQATNEYVVLLDTATRVERRVELSGSEVQQQVPQRTQQFAPQQPAQQAVQQAGSPVRQQTPLPLLPQHTSQQTVPPQDVSTSPQQHPEGQQPKEMKRWMRQRSAPIPPAPE